MNEQDKNRDTILNGIRSIQFKIGHWAKEWQFRERGIEDPMVFGTKVGLCHTELSEALEKHRKLCKTGKFIDEPDEHCPQHGSVAVEFADTVIRILEMTEEMGIDLAPVIYDKVAFNFTRPKKHNKAY